jgi:lipoate-protein ligase A
MAERPTLIDLTLPSPAENLALDEALLDICEESWRTDGEVREFVRFWESPSLFVVLGVAGKRNAEVKLSVCQQRGVPVLRRASGGGTVVQGPGCLNFTLVLTLPEHPELQHIDGSYRAILARLAGALGDDRLGQAGISDLALGPLKISGNAQKRSRHALLHHGTLLYDFALEDVTALLKEPQKQPPYREQRQHRDFVTNLTLSRSTLQERIAQAWHASPPTSPWSPPGLASLIQAKYDNPEWNERF